jgi:hypothetical protein
MNAIKTLKLALGITLAAAIGTSARAEVTTLSTQDIIAMSSVAPLNLINWKVGDKMSYQVSMGFLGAFGAMTKEVTKEEGDTIWLHQVIDLKFQKQTVDVQMSRVDGHIIKMIQDGREMQIPNDKLEVISQDYGDVTVPAGTFAAVHIVAKTQSVSKIEIWANPAETVLDGALKQIMATQIGELTMECTSFAHGN